MDIKIDISMPVPQDRIKIELEKVDQLIKAKEAEMDVLRAVRSSITNFCKHPSKRTVHDYGGGSDTYCTVCGKNVW